MTPPASTTTLPAGVWRCHGHNIAPKASCPKCGKRNFAPSGVGTPPVVEPRPVAKGRNVCVLGHSHDSKGEALCCPIVVSVAAEFGMRVVRPGKPGIPIIGIVDTATLRPTYVSSDWIVESGGEPVLIVDYKGNAPKSKRYDKGWARGKRMLEAELGCKCVELRSVETALAAVREALNQGGANA